MLAVERPTSGLYLWVLELNVAAQAFYRARGGEVVGRDARPAVADGPDVVVLRVAWPDPSVLTTPAT